MDKYELRDVGIAAALGACIGGILTLAFGHSWWPVGILVGGFMGVFSYRPREAWILLRNGTKNTAQQVRNHYAAPGQAVQDIKEVVVSLTRGLIKGTIIVQALTMWYWYFAIIGIYLIRNGYSYNYELLIVIFPVLAVIFMISGGLTLAFIFSETLRENVFAENEKGWPIVKFLRIGTTWHFPNILIHKSEDTSPRYAIKCVFIIIGAPLLLFLFFTFVAIDVLLTAWMHLATNTRIAAMEGAVLGSLSCYICFATGIAATAPIAVTIGTGTGALIGVGIYALRCHTFNVAPAQA